MANVNAETAAVPMVAQAEPDPTEAVAVSKKKEPAPASAAPALVRRAKLSLAHIGMWSALKYAFLACILLFVAWMALVAGVYELLRYLKVFEPVSDTLRSTLNLDNGAPGTTVSFLQPKPVFTVAAAIGVVFAFLSLLLGMVLAAAHNVVSRMTGGLELTLVEKPKKVRRGRKA